MISESILAERYELEVNIMRSETHKKTSFYHKSVFTTEPQKNDFKGLNSGFYVTFYNES